MSSYVAPAQARSLRACMVCSIVQPSSKFQREGCPNCEAYLSLRGNADGIAECTSQVYEGLIALTDARGSWVARFQRLEGYVPGVYATKVSGSLPEDVVRTLENAGVTYIPRDGSTANAEA